MRVCPVCRAQYPPGANFCPNDGQALEDLPREAAEDDRFLGELLDGRYRIETRIGQGGMGMVYAARHVMIDKAVAIKVLRHEYCRDKSLVQRFIREARAASRIGHPNIVDVTDFGTLTDGHIFFVMEYLQGQTLGGLVKSTQGMPLARVADLALQMCHGLGAAHAMGIVHRDLKPENIFVVNPRQADEEPLEDPQTGRRRDFVKLLDFGIAKFNFGSKTRLTRIGSVFGTPQYMCPEQASGEDADHRGDIYSLGCILYEMVTGQVPFTSDTFMGTLTKHMFERPLPLRERRPDLSLSQELEGVVDRMLAKDPKDRLQSMADVAAELRVFAPDSEAIRFGLAPHDTIQEHTLPPLGTYPPGPTSLDLRSSDRHPAVERDGIEVTTNEPESTGEAALPLTRQKMPTDAVHPLSAGRTRWGYRWMGWAIGVVVVAVSAGVLATVVMDRYRPAASQTPAMSPPVVQAVPDARPPTPDRGPRVVTMTFNSTPTGSEVWRGGIYIGTTPTKESLKEGTKALYEFKKKGFADIRRLVVFSESAQSVVIELKRQGRRRIRRNKRSIRDLRNPFPRGPTTGR